MFQGRHVPRSLPTYMNMVAVVAMGIVVVLFAIFWTGMASLMVGRPGSAFGGGFSPLVYCIPLFVD